MESHSDRGKAPAEIHIEEDESKMGSPPPSDSGNAPTDIGIDPAELTNYIEACIKSKLNQQQTCDYLESTYNVDPVMTRAVMAAMEREAERIVKAHFHDQINILQKLLQLQIAMMGKNDEIPMVKKYVEFCIECVMTKEETVDFLATNCKIDKAKTLAEWKKQRRENPQLFREYYMKMNYKNQKEAANKSLQKNAPAASSSSSSSNPKPPAAGSSSSSSSKP